MNSGYVVVRFGGHWEGLEYKNSEEEVVRVEPGQMNYSEILEEVYGVVEVDRGIYDCVMHAIVDVSGNKLGKLKLKNDRDIESPFKNIELPVVFGILKRRMGETSSHNVLGSQSGHNRVENVEGQQDIGGSFMQLMATQNDFSTVIGPNYNYMNHLGFQQYGVPHINLYSHVVRPSGAPFMHMNNVPIIDHPRPLSPTVNVPSIHCLGPSIRPSNEDGFYPDMGCDNTDANRDNTDADVGCDNNKDDYGDNYSAGDADCNNNADDFGENYIAGDVSTDVEANNQFENDQQRAEFEEFCEWRRRRREVFPENQNQDAAEVRGVNLHPDIHRDNVHETIVPTGRSWVIPGTLSHLSVPPEEPARLEASGGTLRQGATYMSKTELDIALGMYHLENQVEYRVERSDKTRFHAICKYERCPFRMRAYGKDGIWRVGKFDKHHGCGLNLNDNASRRVHSKVVGAYFASRLLVEHSTLVPRDMIAELESRHGLKMSYNVALSAKHHAFGLIYGDSNKSFNLIPAYLHMLNLTNPGSVTRWKSDNFNRFKYVFFALHASITGFQNNARPVIVIDGTHLKGKYRGILFVAVTKDGNEQIFPLAVGIGDVENDDSWTWFLRQLRDAYNCPRDLLIVSDQHKSISNAIKAVYPEASHGLCTYHLQSNLAQYGQHIVAMFRNAAYSYRREDYDKYFENIKVASETGAFKKLERAGEDRWSRVKCPVRRYGFMTSNSAESFNSRLLWARKLPVCSVLECARTIIEKWFYERRTAANDKDQELTLEATKRLNDAVEIGRRMDVQCLSNVKYKVKDGTKTYLVDLSQRTCSCREFEYELMPCAHASAAIRKANLNIYSFAAHYYKNENLQKMWAGEVLPVPDPSEWVLPQEVRDLVCNPPNNPRQAGRPRQSRVHSAVESSSNRSRKSQICSRCGGAGHNCVKCTMSLPLDEHKSALVTQPGPSRQVRSKKKCGICRADDHTRRKCPRRPDDEN